MRNVGINTLASINRAPRSSDASIAKTLTTIVSCLTTAEAEAIASIVGKTTGPPVHSGLRITTSTTPSSSQYDMSYSLSPPT